MIHFHGQTNQTESAPLYMTKLCKHFRHKIPVELEAEKAHAQFPYGECRMYADQQNIRFDCQVNDASKVEQMKEVIFSHLVRFAPKEELVIDWADGAL